MGPATLGGVPGAGDARSRGGRDQKRREWRGTFFFDVQHEAAIEKLAAARAKVPYEGPIDGKPQKVSVTILSYTAGTGAASFEGSGELA